MKGALCCAECHAIEYCYVGGDILRNSVTRVLPHVCHQRSIVKCCENMLSADRINVRLNAAFTLGSAVLQGHAGLGVVALRLHWEV